MNIAYFSHYFTPEIGAPSARLYDFSKQWISLGNKVQVVTCFPNHPMGKLYPGYKSQGYKHEELDDINVHRHWTYITPNKGFIKKTLGHISYYPSALFWSNRRIKNPDISIGTSPTFFAAMGASSLAKKNRIPFVMEIRDLWPAIFVELGVIRSQKLIQWLEKWELNLYKKATKIVTVTESFRRNLIDRGQAERKVATIPNGADTEFWCPDGNSEKLRERLGLRDKYVILYIGAHGISHALGRILESAERLKKEEQIQFLFVGEGAEKEQLLEKKKEMNLNNVQFIEPVGKELVKQYYELADVCLVPLRNIPLFETFIPSKMFEIMAMERPIVGSVRGEAADIMNRSGGAVVVAPEDSLAITEAINDLFRDKAKARTMGKNGRKFVIDHYSRRALAIKYLEFLREAGEEYRAQKS